MASEVFDNPKEYLGNECEGVRREREEIERGKCNVGERKKGEKRD